MLSVRVYYIPTSFNFVLMFYSAVCAGSNTNALALSHAPVTTVNTLLKRPRDTAMLPEGLPRKQQKIHHAQLELDEGDTKVS